MAPNTQAPLNYYSGAVLLDLAPERLQARHAPLGRVAGDQRRIDRVDRRTDHPIGPDAGFVQRLIHTLLVGAERAAALRHQLHLARQRGSDG